MVVTALRERPVAWPFVKWVGGKAKLLPELLKRAPRSFERYVEPFAGGAALFFGLRPKQAMLGDYNADLIDCYRAVRDEVDAVIVQLKLHAPKHSDAYYYEVRSSWNRREYVGATRAARAAEFLYLNKTCYNGVWRVNKRGGFNVPVGDYKNPNIVNAQVLRAASAALQDVALHAGDYRDAVLGVGRGDFVYFDPPYDETFNGYTSAGRFDQRALALTFNELAARGARVMLSNSDTPLVRELYSAHRIDTVRCPRAVNADGAGRGDVNEVLVMSYP